MDTPPRPTTRDDFEVAIICALPLEYDAVVALLDGFWDDHGDAYGKAARDQNTYTTGWIGRHNVVLALLSGMGKINANSVATSLGLSFGHVKIAFVVGVCGAVPVTGAGAEIALGDVIVSQQVLEYDFGRRYADRMVLKDKLSGSFGQSHNARRFMGTMQTDRYRGLLSKRALGCLRGAQEKYPEKYRSLQRTEDRLFPSTYRHKHQTGCGICDQCTAPAHPVCDAALTSTCAELQCDESQLVPRSRLQATPIIHWGIIASGDTVMKSALDRDALARHNIIGFEMEGAGVCDQFPSIIVKGACDYADSHKSKEWQNYAAVTAACVMKALLNWYPRTDRELSRGAMSLPIVSSTQLRIRQSRISGPTLAGCTAERSFHELELASVSKTQQFSM
jgi:nucleoside phosphorylase